MLFDHLWFLVIELGQFAARAPLDP